MIHINEQKTNTGPTSPINNLIRGHCDTTITITFVDNPKLSSKDESFPIVSFNGKDQWLRTDRDFSIASWVYLDGDYFNGNLSLPEGKNALTAVSQDSIINSPFQLGVRTDKDILKRRKKRITKWCFTISPELGNEIDAECVDAFSDIAITHNGVNRWQFIVGVCNYGKNTISIANPTLQDFAKTTIYSDWKPWRASQSTIIGKGQWDYQDVDIWKGKVDPTTFFPLTEQEIYSIYNKSKDKL